MKQYKCVCIKDDCFNIVKELDIERDDKGRIYERSKICWKCRTKADSKAIKRWRNKHNKKSKNNII